jgi:hypothetical protein
MTLQGFYDSLPPIEDEDAQMLDMLYTFEHMGIMLEIVDKTIKYNTEEEDWYAECY